VFAGLHYPSDNLASWIIAMRLAGLVFPNPAVKVHLWKAISRQSLVFEATTYEPI
jgi:membrane-associated phospholipid phosphatase